MTAEHTLPLLSSRLIERLAATGTTIVRVSSDGGAATVGKSRSIDRIVLASPMFADAIRRHWGKLHDRAGEAVDIWPGLWLAVLPRARRRRPASERFDSAAVAALLIGTDIVEAEQLRSACDAAGVDFQGAIASIEPAELMGRHEVQRFARTLAWMHEDATEIDRRLAELKSLSTELAESYEELSLLYKLSMKMTFNQPPADFLNEACRELHQVSGLRWLTLKLINDEPRLQLLAGRVFTSGSISASQSALSELGGKLMNGVGDCEHGVIIDDTATLGLPEAVKLARTMLLTPLRIGDRLIGLLFGGDKLDGDHISSIDSKLCDSLANSLAIFLQNLMLYEDMQSMFLGILHALTSAIDAKDSYTHGHSERVALISRMLAQAAGLPIAQVERIYIAGLLHDVGKIGVPEAVLGKPGKLTPEEYELIKLHPQIGARILEDMPQMSDLIPGVLFHHERWDGRGYPDGLAREDIPLMGRIIGLADAFDAMSSDRTYRRAMDLHQVKREIIDSAGSQFDPNVVSLFLTLDFTPYYELIEKHQQLVPIRRTA